MLLCINADSNRVQAPLSVEQRDAVRSVLSAFAMRNPAVGYLSGHHSVAAGVRLSLTAEPDAERPAGCGSQTEHAFWIYAALLERAAVFTHTPQVAATRRARGPRSCRRVCSRTGAGAGRDRGRGMTLMLLADLPVTLHRTLFADQGEVGLRIVDALLLCGPEALLRVGLALLERATPRLLECADSDAALRASRSCGSAPTTCRRTS